MRQSRRVVEFPKTSCMTSRPAPVSSISSSPPQRCNASASLIVQAHQPRYATAETHRRSGNGKRPVCPPDHPAGLNRLLPGRASLGSCIKKPEIRRLRMTRFSPEPLTSCEATLHGRNSLRNKRCQQRDNPAQARHQAVLLFLLFLQISICKGHSHKVQTLVILLQRAVLVIVLKSARHLRNSSRKTDHGQRQAYTIQSP